MATSRTTLRIRTRTKLDAVRGESGKVKDIQTYRRAHVSDVRHESQAVQEAARGSIEKKVSSSPPVAKTTVEKAAPPKTSTRAASAAKKPAENAARYT